MSIQDLGMSTVCGNMILKNVTSFRQTTGKTVHFVLFLKAIIHVERGHPNTVNSIREPYGRIIPDGSFSAALRSCKSADRFVHVSEFQYSSITKFAVFPEPNKQNTIPLGAANSPAQQKLSNRRAHHHKTGLYSPSRREGVENSLASAGKINSCEA